MRILYITDGGPGGVSSHVRCLTQCLKGVAEVMVCITYRTEALKKMLEEDGTPSFCCGCTNGHDWRLLFKVREVIREFRPDVIHFHDIPLLAALYVKVLRWSRRWRGLRVVCSLHTPSARKVAFSRNVLNHAVQPCYFLPVSGPTWEVFKSAYPWAKGEVFFNPMRIEKSKGEVEERNDKDFVVGMVGRNADQKDWPSFCKVAEEAGKIDGLRGLTDWGIMRGEDWLRMCERDPETLTVTERRLIVERIEKTEEIIVRQPGDERVRRMVKGYWDGNAKITKEIVDWGKEIVPERVDNDFVGEIQTHKNALRSILFHTRFRGPLKVLILQHLEQILRHAVLFNKGRDGDEVFYNLAHRMRFELGNGEGSKEFIVRLIVRETAEGNRTWTVEFSNKKELTGVPTTGEAATVAVTRLSPPSTHTILKLIYAVNEGSASEVKGKARDEGEWRNDRISFWGVGVSEDEAKGYGEGAKLVEWKGLQPNGREWIGKMDLFVMTSKHEQLPTTVLECFVMGTPVCGFVPWGGMSDILALSKGPLREAFIAERDCAKLAGIVRELAAEPEKRRALVEDGRQILEGHFDAEKNVRGRLMEIYRGCGEVSTTEGEETRFRGARKDVGEGESEG